MRWGVFLLILLDCCSVFRCHLRKFVFIKEGKKWHDAQIHCRKHHHDLATIYDREDNEEIIKDIQGSNWIGLQRTNENSQWHWSLPGVKETAEKLTSEPPDDNGVEKKCASMKNGTLSVESCTTKLLFCCYNESQNKTQLVTNCGNWTEAQEHCRKEHTDLVSGDEQLKMASYTGQCWIGLFRDNWSWSDGSDFSFRNWESNSSENKKCAALKPSGKWKSNPCKDVNPFVCYKDKTVLIKENKTWEESLVYCRQHHNDLVSITNPEDQKWVQIKAKNASSSHVWLGLRYTCALRFWFWVSDEVVKYNNWEDDRKTDDCDMSGAMETGGQHKWKKHLDTKKFNFICSKS